MQTVPYAPTHQQAADAYTEALLDQLTRQVAAHQVRITTRKHVRAGLAVDQARQNRDDAIRAALTAGIPARDVANAAALTVVRVQQIRRGTR